MRRAVGLVLAALGACGGAPPAPAPQAPAAPEAPAEGSCVNDAPYQPRPAYEGRNPELPPPDRSVRAIKTGDDFTVWGATHHLRSRVHRAEVDRQRISVVGYVVRTNYDRAPACAVHRIGVGDKAGCRSEVPSFAIADEKGETRTAIDVKGWASNFAQLFTLIEAIDKAPKGEEPRVELQDEFWGGTLPNPVPAVGAKVKVTGTYAVTFTKATGGAAADPKYGILTAERIELLEPSPKRAVLPGMKLNKR